jgi:hypothetical protein
MRGNEESRERPADVFERLLLLRTCYPLRSDFDARGILSVEQAIHHGELLMRRARWQQRRTWPGPSRTAA